MRKLSVAAALMLLLAACGSSSYNPLGGVLGSPSVNQPSQVQGTVNFIDTTAQRIDMNVSYVNNLRSSQGSQSIYYSNNTTVQWNGGTYRPEDLERGDQVSINGHTESGRYVADTIYVTRNIRQ
jgi:hypothetical protein